MRFLITAIGSMSADAVIGSLRENFPKCEIVGTNIYPGEWLFLADKVDAFIKVPKATEASYITSIIDIVKSKNIDMIIPLTDPEVDVLSENREKLEIHAVLALCSNDVIKICRDKEMLSSYIKTDVNLKTIKSFTVNEACKLSLQYPVVAKPKNGRSSEGLKFIDTQEEISLLDENYIIQEFIEGMVITVDIVRDYFGNIAWVSRKELIRTSNGAGLTVEIFEDRKIEKLIAAIIEQLDMRGCMNIEFILRKGTYFLMDINPRFSAGIGFSKLAGYDFVRNHVIVFMNGKVDSIQQLVPGIATKHYADYMLKS